MHGDLSGLPAELVGVLESSGTEFQERWTSSCTSSTTPSAPRILASAIHALAEGAGWLDPNVIRKLLEEFPQTGAV
jgi:hypothetical protein